MVRAQLIVRKFVVPIDFKRSGRCATNERGEILCVFFLGSERAFSQSEGAREQR